MSNRRAGFVVMLVAINAGLLSTRWRLSSHPG